MKLKIKAQYEELTSAAFVVKCPEGEMPNTITKHIGTLEKEPALEGHPNGKTQKDHWDEGEMECLCRFWVGHMKDTTEANGCRSGVVEKKYTTFHNKLIHKGYYQMNKSSSRSTMPNRAARYSRSMDQVTSKITQSKQYLQNCCNAIAASSEYGLWQTKNNGFSGACMAMVIDTLLQSEEFSELEQNAWLERVGISGAASKA